MDHHMKMRWKRESLCRVSRSPRTVATQIPYLVSEGGREGGKEEREGGEGGREERKGGGEGGKRGREEGRDRVNLHYVLQVMV